MVLYSDVRTVECPFISFASSGEILVGEALGDDQIEMYTKWCRPHYKVLKKIGIDLEIYQDLQILYNLFEPLMANLYTRKLGQMKKNVI